MVVQLQTFKLHSKLEQMHNETCRTSRLEIAAKTLMKLRVVGHFEEHVQCSCEFNKRGL